MSVFRHLRRKHRADEIHEAKVGRRWRRPFRAARVWVYGSVGRIPVYTYVSAGNDAPLTPKGRRIWRGFAMFLVVSFVVLVVLTLSGR